MTGTYNRNNAACVRIFHTASTTSANAIGSLLRIRDRSGRHVTGLGAWAVGLNGRGLILRSVGYLLILDDTGRGP